MSLFKLCYGPEIESVFNVILKNPGITSEELTLKFSYKQSRDISSLINEVVEFLFELGLISQDNKKDIYPNVDCFEKTLIIKKIGQIAKNGNAENSNYIFCSILRDLFIIPNTIFIKDLHYFVNNYYQKIPISKEKVNAWKRIMEFLGVGFRAYGGFYALLQLELVENLINKVGDWEGPLQIFIEEKLNEYYTFSNNGVLFKGVLYSFDYLNKNGFIELGKQQDLPFMSYGKYNQWNWIKTGGI